MIRGRRIGILTGGGDAPGLNAVIRAVVRTAERRFSMQVLGVLDGFEGLLERRFEALDSRQVRDLVATGGTVLGTTNRSDPFRFPAGARTVDRSNEILESVAVLDLEGLVVVGGDGTLRIATGLARQGLKLLAVPKTIDNDLGSTAYTVGFWTAISTAAEALDRLRDTAESHHRVMILEVMGRSAGWIALYAGLAGGADVILIPEIPYSPAIVADKIEERRRRGQAHSVVMVAEGAVRVEAVSDATGSGRGGDRSVLPGAGARLAAELADHVEHETRVTVLGHLQRGGTPVPFDRILATRLGVRAVELAAEGRWGSMVGVSGDQIVAHPLSQLPTEPSRVDPHGELVAVARSLGVDMGAEPGVEAPVA